MPSRGLGVLAWLAGCGGLAVEVRSSRIEGADITGLDVTVGRGALEVEGRLRGEVPDFDVSARLEAKGRSEARAADRNAVDEPSIRASRGTLRVSAPATHPSRRTDVTLVGPDDVDVEAVVQDGTVVLTMLTGDHDVMARHVEILGGSGDRRVEADTLVLEGAPVPGDGWSLDLTGDGSVQLPPGLEIALEVVLSEGARVEITPLTAFDDSVFTDDFVRARRGSGAIEIAAQVRRGTLLITERSDLDAEASE